MCDPLSKTPVTIRLAKISDVTAVAECVRLAYQHWISIIGMKPGPMLQDYATVLATEQVYVAEADHQMIGVLVLTIANEGFLLENVAVHPQYTGTGLGSRLLALAEREAIALGYDSIYLYTHERMSANIAKYQKLQYVEYARRLEDGLARVYMRKHLVSAQHT
jgi:N-acetylglutamate synthase-like GNAT family acetyltransferase